MHKVGVVACVYNLRLGKVRQAGSWGLLVGHTRLTCEPQVLMRGLDSKKKGRQFLSNAQSLTLASTYINACKHIHECTLTYCTPTYCISTYTHMSTYLHAYTYKHTYKEQEWEEKEKAPSSWPNYFSIPNAGCTQTFNPWCMWVWSFPQNPSFVQYNSSSYLMSSYTDHIIPPPLNCVILFFPAFFYVSGFSWTYDSLDYAL